MPRTTLYRMIPFMFLLSLVLVGCGRQETTSGEEKRKSDESKKVEDHSSRETDRQKSVGNGQKQSDEKTATFFVEGMVVRNGEV